MSTLEECGVVYGTSKKRDGNMSFLWERLNGGEPENVILNRETYLKTHGVLLDEVVVMSATGDEIVVVDVTHKGRGVRVGSESIDAQALITQDPEVALVLLTADCLPITFYDPVHNVLALAHLGWEQSDNEIATRVIQMMCSQFGSDPKDMVVHVGASIKKASYIVQDPSQKGDQRWNGFVEEAQGGGYHVDVLGFNLKALQEAGIDIQTQVSIDEVDTGAPDGEYFSHYRSRTQGEQNGRMLTVAQLPKETSTHQT